MTVSLYTLGSGSSGNCTYVKCGTTEFLVDAGLSRRDISKKLTRLGTSLENLSAIFVTHEHSDHVKGLPMLSKYDKIPIYGHKLTLNTLKEVDPMLCREIRHPDTVSLGDVILTAIPTPHDSLASCGYVIEAYGMRFGILTDLGRPTDELLDAYDGCHAVILEANYDKTMLKYGPYPTYLKSRIAGNYGHLDNEVTARFVHYLALHGTKHFLLAHLSSENNTPEKAYETVRTLLTKEALSPTLAVASRYEISELCTVEC